MRKIILDCDPGHDDALAILLAAKHLDVLGITTVAGNQTIDKVTANARKVLEFAGLTHIPVAKGANHPLVKPALHAGNIHGESGLDGPVLPEPTIPLDPRHAVDFIIDTVMDNDEVTLVPTGPLTNIAMALHREPRLRERVAEISLMGGGLNSGNVTAAAEFNIYVDPEAAHVVFTSGIPLKMAGLNLTRQANATQAEIERCRALGNRTGQIVAELLTFFAGTIKEVFGVNGGSLHDPCAVAALIEPEMIEFMPLHVAVELHGTHTYGMTVCDVRHLRGIGEELVHVGKQSGETPNAQVGMRINSKRFFDLLIDETLALYP
ncbi:MAG TPA: nucleoside hydrolase [Caldilineaceae bacterium]|nr:nucleoside hydrolase [Caldilineaceae bacterium]